MTAAVGNINLKYLLKTAPVTDYTCLSWKNYRGTTNPETIKNMKIQKFELKKTWNCELNVALSQNGAWWYLAFKFSSMGGWLKL